MEKPFSVDLTLRLPKTPAKSLSLIDPVERRLDERSKGGLFLPSNWELLAGAMAVAGTSKAISW